MIRSIRRVAWLKRVAWLFPGCLAAWAQGPIVSPMVVPTFNYTMNSGTYPAAQLVKVTLPTTLASLPVIVENFSVTPPDPFCLIDNNPSPGCDWLSVTPDSGHAPLTLSVSVNPTGLTPGSYPASFYIDTTPSSGSPVKVSVVLQISNPPSQLGLLSNSPNFTTSTSSASAGSLTFNYTTAAPQASLVSSELDVYSTGDIIPFNVTVANSSSGGSGSKAVWLRVSSISPTQGQATTTSGSAGVGSQVPIYVTLDYTTLQSMAIGQYFATITIAATNAKVNGSKSVSVTLVVSAGQPTLTAVYPQTITPAPPANPVFTLYGTNFTLNTSLFLTVSGTDYQIPWSSMVLVSSKILQATIPSADLPVQSPGNYPLVCTFTIRNGGFPAVTGTFMIVDPSQPSVSFIVNSGSYTPMSTYAGAGLDPGALPNPPTAVSPRGIISIFGQNLGPSIVASASPIGGIYQTSCDGVSVTFTYMDMTQSPPVQVSVDAPILMASINQINAIVPMGVANALALAASAQAAVTVTVPAANGLTTTSLPFPVTVLPEDPAIFTFGGLGQGQGAIINYDASGASSINSGTNQEPRGDIVALFVTGLGVLPNDNTFAEIPDGSLTTSPGIQIADWQNVHVTVGGQPAVVLYAGTSPGAVAGLVQVNVIIPPTSSTGSAPILLTVGSAATGGPRTAQTGVTVAVKK